MLGLLLPVIAWAIAVPFLAQALDLRLGIARSEEELNHVLSGAAGLLGGGLAFWGRRARDARWTLGAAIVFLAGLYVTSAHGTVLRQVLEGDLPAADALLHTSGGPPLLILGMLMLVAGMRSPEPPRRKVKLPR